MSERKYQGEPIDLTHQHLSELEDNCEEPGATEGDEDTTCWPSGATDPEELNETQKAVIQAAADPAKEWSSLQEISEFVAPDKSHAYAANALRKHWPEGHEEFKFQEYACEYCAQEFDSPQAKAGHVSTVHRDEELTHVCEECGERFESAQAKGGHYAGKHSDSTEPDNVAKNKLDVDDVRDIRTRLLAGESPSTLAKEYSVTADTVRRNARGDMGKGKSVESPRPLEYSESDSAWQLKDGEAENAEQQTIDDVGHEDGSAPGANSEDEPQPITDETPTIIASTQTTPDDDPTTARRVAAVVVAVVLAYLLGRRGGSDD